MKQRVLLLSQDLHLFEQLQQTLPSRDYVLCNNLTTLATEMAAPTVHGVLIHLKSSVVNGYPVAHFVSELKQILTNTLVFGLADEDTPARLQQLFEVNFDGCIEMPLCEEDVNAALDRCFDLEADLERFWSEIPHQELHGRSRSLVTFTSEMFEMLDEIRVAAKHRVTSLLIGETGCGKTFLARLIHELSADEDERFCTVACGALPPDLIESELFGYVKGAFTGADRDREGKFAAAGQGTLLLDEIDVLPPDQQAKLLRVIETGEYEPVGSNETQKFEGRLIVASNYDLEDLVRSGTFRTDLYYRLNILNFRLLPLRQRPLDIEYLARKFALEHGRTHGITIRGIDASFLTALRNYPWPGNVREMENVVRRAVLYCQRGVLTINDLPTSIRAALQSPQVPAYEPQPAPVGLQAGMPVLGDGVAFRRYQGNHLSMPMMAPQRPPGLEVWSPSAAVAQPVSPNRDELQFHGGPYRASQPRGQTALDAHERQVAVGQPALAPVDEPRSLEAQVDKLECEIIVDSLNRNNHRRKETAAELEISRVTLYNKMKKFGLLQR